jgi:AmmeMemoRadiSam system protein B
MPGMIRYPAVAGRFYPSDRNDLAKSVESYLGSSLPLAEGSMPTIGCMAPHAGYIYSGATAGAVFRRVEIPRVCLVLCPNHTGQGSPLAIMSEGEWETPLGSVPIDSVLAASLKSKFPSLNEDLAAHCSEHAIEVELPFLQVRRGSDLRFVPIALGTRRFDVLAALGEAIADVLAQRKDNVLIVASSDMNHYENDAITRTKDHKAIEKILALDAGGLFEVVRQEGISMCGLGPAVSMITAARRLGATSAELISYATSADVSGDHERVVGYAGVVIH